GNSVLASAACGLAAAETAANPAGLSAARVLYPHRPFIVSVLRAAGFYREVARRDAVYHRLPFCSEREDAPRASRVGNRADLRGSVQRIVYLRAIRNRPRRQSQRRAS